MPIRRVAVPLPQIAPAMTGVEFRFDIEPYFMGGGAKPRKHDPCAPVRASSVLGQVRWFWRLLHARDPLETLREKEGRLFGAAMTSNRRPHSDQISRAERTGPGGDRRPRQIPSTFAIEVTSAPGTPIRLPRMTEPGGYLLFAARDEKPSQRNPDGVLAADVSTGVKGTIRLVPAPGRAGEFPATSGLDPDLLTAFRLWSLAGGVGARTRRGIGAVQVDGGPTSVEVLVATLREVIGEPVGEGFVGGGGIRGIRAVWVGERPVRSARECLEQLEEWYKRYRQHRRRGVQGRSYWDEPELIRDTLAPENAGRRAQSPNHGPLRPTTNHAPGWARAVFGLPIVFKFKDEAKGDPPLTQLVGRSYDRMASPLLFRPVRLVPNQYVPIVVWLSGPYEPPGGIHLKSRRKRYPVPLTSSPDRVFEDLLPEPGRATPNPLNLRRVL